MTEPRNNISLGRGVPRTAWHLILSILLVATVFAAAKMKLKMFSGILPLQSALFEAAAAEQPTISQAQSSVTVYVASPLGFADSTRSFMFKELIPAIRS